MKEYFSNLFRYNEWANDQVLDVLINIPGDCPDEITKLFNHVISAQMMWLNRIFDRKVILELWAGNTIEGCITASKESSREWLKFTDNLNDSDLAKPVSYINTKGVQYTNTIEDIMIHTINHSTYHRAQVAALCRKYDITPPVTDYIVYKREKQG